MNENSCAVQSQELDEPLAGTAPSATAWLCIEQPGRWGSSALHDSELDHKVATELMRRTRRTGVMPLLMRRPGAAGQSGEVASRQVLLASVHPGRMWVEQAEINDIHRLLELDFAAIGTGIAPGLAQGVGVGERGTDPTFLVCANDARDPCCGSAGGLLASNLVAATLAGKSSVDVWECTHLGGHRFAPTALALPSGYLYGRLDLATAQAIVNAESAGRMVQSNCRGRSAWSAAGQAAELAVRQHIDEDRSDAISVPSVAGGFSVAGTTVNPPASKLVAELVAESSEGISVDVQHADGRGWRVQMTENDLFPPRPTSCGRALSTPTAIVVQEITPL